MRAEAQAEAEATLAKIAQTVREKVGIEPEMVIREGVATAQIHALIEEDRDNRHPGAGRRLRQGWTGAAGRLDRRQDRGLPIPVTVIPDLLTDEDIEALS